MAHKLKALLLAAAALAFSGYSQRKQIAYNIMSHAGFHEGSVSILSPFTYFTTGHYRGFNNTILNVGMRDDHRNHVADPLNKLPPHLHDLDLPAVYLGLQENSLPKSSYRPTRLSNAENIEFYSIADFIVKPDRLVGKELRWVQIDLEKVLNLKPGEVISSQGNTDISSLNFTNVDLGSCTVSFGRDERGIYTSIYDVWDFVPHSGFFRQGRSRNPRIFAAGIILPQMGTPIHIYDRLYWNDYGANEDELRSQMSKR